MINSILEKSYRKIVVDRIRIEDPISGENRLVMEPDEIKKEAIKTYEKFFRERHYKFDNLPDKQQEIYRPKDDIDDQCYHSISQEPSDDE